MRSIGIRVEPKEIHYTIIKGNYQNEFIIQSIKLPKALNNDIPRLLSFIRTTFISIITEYEIELAGLRTAEGNARNPSIFRMNVEGVIQELFSDSAIKHYFSGTLTSIGSRVKKSNSEIRDCRNGDKNLFEVEGWSEISQNKRESFLAALAILTEIKGDHSDA